MSNKHSGGGGRRKYYRLRYPQTNRPTFRLADWSFEVTELSEKGFRFLDPEGRANTQYGQTVTGEIELFSNPIAIHGTVSRIHDEEVVVVAVNGVTFKCILDEQRLLASGFLY